MTHGPGFSRAPDPQIEIEGLRDLSLRVSLYLSAVLVLSFFIGAVLIGVFRGEVARLLGVALIGCAGSAVAALTSSLDRYGNGFELELTGEKVPPVKEGEKKETFNRRMARWFYFRPLLGLVVAPVFVWGIELFTDQSGRFAGKLGFTAFMGGLLAKSVLDLIKGLFKNVFKS